MASATSSTSSCGNDIQTAEDIQEALNDLLGGTIKEMMEVEMDEHLGYGSQNVLTMKVPATAIRASV